MATLYWQTFGRGTRDFVLLHGWGMNSEVWRSIAMRLSSQFRIHVVDLPGYGRSQGFPAMTLDDMAQWVWARAPKNAIWLGWSLGGLVASRIALAHENDVAGLVTVASSPCFAEHADWPGMKLSVLQNFEKQLSTDFQRTIERFIALQTLGTENARDDAKLLKAVVLEQPFPNTAVLRGGLDILRTADLRLSLTRLSLPFLRVYGHLDGLVPHKVIPIIDALLPNSHSVVLRHSAHAPFISHSDEFVENIFAFTDTF